MNINKKMLVFVSFVAAITTAIMIFYSGTDEDIKEDREVVVKEENIEEPDSLEMPETFILFLEGDNVTLYCNGQEGRVAVESVKIDRNYYPDEDIKALTEGITAYNIEEGYKILENFAN